MEERVGRLRLVLHTHLPVALNHGRWPHGSDWLSEVTIECYLPLLRVLTRLAEEDIGPTVTVDLSPVLCEQMASPLFREEVGAMLAQRLESCEEARRYFTDAHEDRLAALCTFWRGFYEDARRQFDALEGNLLGAFRDLADREAIELISTGATHGYFPLLSRDESLDLQIRTAVATHVRHFGRAPRGLWLPECGYRPGTSGRRRWGRGAARSGTGAGASRSCWRRTRSSTSSPTCTWSAGGAPFRPTGTTSRGCARWPSRRRRSTGGETAARMPRTASRRGAGPGRRRRSCGIPRPRYRSGAGTPAIPATSGTWSSTRSTGRGGSDSGASPIPGSTWDRSRSTCPSARGSARKRTRTTSPGWCGTCSRGTAGRRAGEASSAARSTPSCSATGGGKAPGGSSRSSAASRSGAWARSRPATARGASQLRGRSRCWRDRGAREETTGSG